MKIKIISTNKSKYISNVRSVYSVEFAPYRILETIILKRKKELRPNYLLMQRIIFYQRKEESVRLIGLMRMYVSYLNDKMNFHFSITSSILFRIEEHFRFQ